MLKLRRRAMRHFVMLIEIHVHLIRVNPGHICKVCHQLLVLVGFDLSIW